MSPPSSAISGRAAFSDRLVRPRGWFVLAVHRDGDLVELVEEPNLVVAGMAAIQAQVMGGALAAPGIARIGFGSSMMPAQPGNTTLTGAFTKALDGVAYPAPGTVSFSFSLASGEANGLSIGEFGLLSAAGVLAARKVRTLAPLAKSTSLSLSGTWTLVFH